MELKDLGGGIEKFWWVELKDLGGGIEGFWWVVILSGRNKEIFDEGE